MEHKVKSLRVPQPPAGVAYDKVEAVVGTVDQHGRALTLKDWPGQAGPIEVRGHMDGWTAFLRPGDRVVAMPGPHGPYVLFRLKADAEPDFDARGRRIVKAEAGLVIEAGDSVVELGDGLTRFKARHIDIEAEHSVRIFSNGVQIN